MLVAGEIFLDGTEGARFLKRKKSLKVRRSRRRSRLLSEPEKFKLDARKRGWTSEALGVRVVFRQLVPGGPVGVGERGHFFLSGKNERNIYMKKSAKKKLQKTRGNTRKSRVLGLDVFWNTCSGTASGSVLEQNGARPAGHLGRPHALWPFGRRSLTTRGGGNDWSRFRE